MPRVTIPKGSRSLSELRREIRSFAKPHKAKDLQRFFKTGPGDYGEGDRFLGVMVPETRSLAKKYSDLNHSSIQVLLGSEFHEERLLGLLILVLNFQKGTKAERKTIYRFYVQNLHCVNNWDLVDLTAPHIVGATWQEGGVVPVQKWVKSRNLWERRITIVATAYLIRENRFSETLQLAKQLLGDSEDLIHKAVGWMLREVGKKDQKVLEQFLDKHIPKMPRTTLRYAIERFPEKKRKAYLKR